MVGFIKEMINTRFMTGINSSRVSRDCSNCREREYCIVDLYNGARHREVSSADEASETELAVEVIRRREEFFRLLRQDLELQLRLYANNKSPEL